MLTKKPSHVRLDPVGGIAGDMFAAALLDAWPELEGDLLAALESAGITRLATVRRVGHVDHALSGSRFEVREVGSTGAEAAHGHRHHRDIQDFLRAADLAAGVRERALDIFDRLARAEAKVHGVDPAEVSFHEVGQWDSIADIVSAAWLIEALGEVCWSCEPLPLGRGRVATAHGPLSVPAPATAVLLESLPTFQDEHRGERVTPTGAAIVRHLDPSFRPVPGILRLERSGTGFGNAVFEGMSNTLRVLAFSEVGDGRFSRERVAVVAFELDDQTGEDLALGLERLRAFKGVLDVTQAPVFGKKGRLAARVQVLAQLPVLDLVVEACFVETTTLGVRWQIAERAMLEREEAEVRLDDRAVSVKTVERPGGIVTRKAGSDDLADVEGGRAERDRLRRRLESSETGE